MHCPHCQAPNALDARFCGACGKTMSSTEPVSHPNLGEAPQLIGREIAGRYRIQQKLGEGGMGAVYRAEQIALKRACAVKLLRPDLSASPMLIQRFKAEAAAVAKLKHPNTVHVYDFGQDTDGTLYIAMEYVEGSSLRSVIQSDAPLPLRRGLKIASQIAASIANAHGKQIVHRDLKPDNVMLHDEGRDRDQVTVLDFGIAKLRDDNRGTQMQMTQAGDMLGTPQYMAPEQIRAEAIDGRVDVYALGCMLYEMFTARMAFEGPTVMALLSKHLMEQVVPPSQRRPDLMLPPAIDHLVMSAMAKEAQHRPPTMDAYAEQIAAVLATLPSDTTTPMSAVHGVPHSAVPTPAAAGRYETPPASAYAAPAGFGPPAFGPPGPPAARSAGAGPPPPGYAQTPPPHGYGPPPYQTPAPTPYQTPAPAGTPPAPAHSPFAAAAPSGTSRTILIVLAVALLGGGGFAAYHFASKKPDKRVVDPPKDPDDVIVPTPGSDHEEPDHDDKPTPDDDDDKPADPKDDPWAGGTAPTAPSMPESGLSSSPLGGASNAVLPAGARLIAPAGYVHQGQPSAQIVINPKTQLAVMMFPVPGTESDPDALARNWVQTTKVKLEGKVDFVSHGRSRPVLGFSGMNGRTPVKQVIVLYFSDSYRIAVMVAGPSKIIDGRTFGDWLLKFMEKNVVLPGA